MRNNYYILALVLLLFSCESSSNKFAIKDSPDVANIEIKKYPEKEDMIDFKQYVDSTEYVYLQTGDDLLINNIDRVFLLDSSIITICQKTATIAFFDSEGKYMSKIAKKGRGHGEYLMLSDVMVDEENKRVMVYDEFINKILYYDFSGAYLRSIELKDYNLHDIINLPNGNFLCYRYIYMDKELSYFSGLWTIDSNGKYVKSIYQEKEDFPDRDYYGKSYLSILEDSIVSFHNYNKAAINHIIGDKAYCRSRYSFPDKTREDYAGVGGMLGPNVFYTDIYNNKETSDSNYMTKI